jgi:hypothetical protein
MKFTPAAGVVAGLIDNFVKTCHSDNGQFRTFFDPAKMAPEERADACISPLKIWLRGAVRI